jgi:hypothetical protein
MKSTLYPQKSAHTRTHTHTHTHTQSYTYTHSHTHTHGPETADRSCLPDVPGQLVPCDGIHYKCLFLFVFHGIHYKYQFLFVLQFTLDGKPVKHKEIQVCLILLILNFSANFSENNNEGHHLSVNFSMNMLGCHLKLKVVAQSTQNHIIGSFCLF